MAYTNIWDDTKPTGSEPANTIDDLMRSMKVDIEQRFNDMFAMPSFATDPLRLYGLKFTDAQDAVINLGDNGGTPRNLIVKNKAGSITFLTIGTNIALTTNQNATTSLIVTNTDVTNATSRAELRVVGGAISGIFSSIATDALYIGATTNSIVRFISNGAEKFRLNTDGTVTFQNAISTNAGGANITGGVAIQTGGLSVVAGDANFAAGIKQTGTVVARFENTVITRPAGSTGSGVEIGAGIIQSYNATGAAYTTLLIQSTLTTFAQGGVVAPSIRTATTTGVVFATGVFVTLFAPTVKGLYMVSVTNEANGATGPNGLGFLLFNGGTDINLIGQFLSFANNSFGVSAGNIQYKQQSIASATMTWTYQLIG